MLNRAKPFVGVPKTRMDMMDEGKIDLMFRVFCIFFFFSPF